ncbi:MAG: formyltransferase family protein [Polyangiaceae bacterium]
MKIAFFGLPLAALLLDADGHDLVYAGICRKGAPGTRRAKTRLSCPVEILPKLDDAKTRAAIAATAPDLLVSWFWTKKIPKAILQLPTRGAFGVHPSLLPRHRGPDPYFWAIDAGDAVTGVTAHRLEEAYDTGATLGARELAIDPKWNAWTLAKKLDRPSLALLRETAKAFASGRPPREEKQDEASATAAPAPADEDLELSFEWPAERILRRIRAASPWPGAYFDVSGTLLTIVRADIAPEVPKALAPGEAAVVDGRVLVRTGEGAIVVHEARREAPLEHEGGHEETLTGGALALAFGTTALAGPI